MSSLIDQFQRTHQYLRLSLTDRCNLRCVYCMPAEGLQWIPSPEILTKDEVIYLAQVFVQMGIEHIRLTGGEPTVRKDLLEIVQGLAKIEGLQDLSMTTNALTFSKLALPLRKAGLQRVNISIDSLQPDRFSDLTRGGKLNKVLAGIDAAYQAGFGIDSPIKLNVVVIANKNDDEILKFCSICCRTSCQYRTPFHRVYALWETPSPQYPHPILANTTLQTNTDYTCPKYKFQHRSSSIRHRFRIQCPCGVHLSNQQPLLCQLQSFTTLSSW